MLTKELESQVNGLWDKFWSGGLANPLQAIEQITYLLFMKQLDDRDTKRMNDAKFTGESYTSLFAGQYWAPGSQESDSGVPKEALRWSNWQTLPADQMLALVRNQVFPFVQSLGGEESAFSRHMSNAVFLIPKSSLLVEGVKTINRIYQELENANRFIDAQGDFYELLLKQLSGAGKNGQFRTPTHLIEMMVDLLQPKLGQRIADPACGSAGFLLGAYKYIITEQSSDQQVDDNGFLRGSSGDKLVDDDLKKVLASQTFYGFDIDATMIRIGLMNLMMHGITEPQIEYTDTLSRSYNEEGRYDMVLANPPFTGKIDKGDLNEQFELNTTKSELLFVERIYRMLRIGGTAGVIVPQGVLFGSSKVYKQLRQMLVDRCELRAVISMPSGFFKPYTGVATAILVFTKGGLTEEVWFYNMQSDGYSLDDKRNPLKDKNGDRDFGDLHAVVDAFHQKKKNQDRKAQHFAVPKSEVESNGYDLSFNRYHEEEYEEVVYEKPKVILEKLEKIESEISDGLKDLKGIL